MMFCLSASPQQPKAIFSHRRVFCMVSQTTWTLWPVSFYEKYHLPVDFLLFVVLCDLGTLWQKSHCFHLLQCLILLLYSFFLSLYIVKSNVIALPALIRILAAVSTTYLHFDSNKLVESINLCLFNTWIFNSFTFLSALCNISDESSKQEPF